MDIKKAREIVAALIDDLTDRSGLQNEWEAIDDETQDEIRQTWAEIVFERANGL